MIATDFDTAINYVIGNEGGLEENPSDPGGITKYGISLRFLLSFGNEYDFNKDGKVDAQEIKDLSLENAKIVYKEQWWDKAPFDKIISQTLCNYILDMAVNMGIGVAVKITQRSVNCVVHNQELKEDGVFGNKTLDQINHGGFMLMPALRASRIGEYRLIACKNPDLKIYLEGWTKRALVS